MSLINMLELDLIWKDLKLLILYANGIKYDADTKT